MTSETRERMLAKGIADGVSIVPLGNGIYSTRSAKTPFGVTYVTTVSSCTCPSTHGYCKHIAHVQAVEAERDVAPLPATEDGPDLGHIIEGMLADLWDQSKADFPEPEQPEPFDPPVAEACGHCGGSGRRDYHDEVRPGVWRWTSEPCNACDPDVDGWRMWG